jgi:ribosomal-protein-alanine N-acetyltransferase
VTALAGPTMRRFGRRPRNEAMRAPCRARRPQTARRSTVISAASSPWSSPLTSAATAPPIYRLRPPADFPQASSPLLTISEAAHPRSRHPEWYRCDGRNCHDHDHELHGRTRHADLAHLRPATGPRVLHRLPRVSVDWTHQFDGQGPTYTQISRGSLVLHLSEHHGDGTPGQAIYVAATGVRDLHAELEGKEYPFLKPGVGPSPGINEGTCMTLLDLFGNTLRLDERPDAEAQQA